MNGLRVGVIGLGRMGKNHCRIYSTLNGVTLAGVCDCDTEQGSLVAGHYDTPFYSEVGELLREVDAVSVVTPTPTHFDLVMRCVDRGIHVLVEKPMTETLEQAAELVTAVERSGLIVQVGHIERFNPAYGELQHVLDEVSMLTMDLRRLSPYQGSNTDVDVIGDLMIHDLDLVLDLMGREPSGIDAHGLAIYGNVIDHATAHLHFDRGPLLSVTASRITEQKVRSIDVTAREAFVQADLLNKAISLHRRTIGEYLNQNHHGVKYRQESIVEFIHVPMFEPLLLELEHFVDCVAQRHTPRVSARAGLRALELAQRIRVSATRNLVDLRAS